MIYNLVKIINQGFFMRKRVMFAFLILLLGITANNNRFVSASQRIEIRFGGIFPENMGVNITESGTYILTKNVANEILIHDSDIIFDGNGYNFSGKLSILNANNVTLQNHFFNGTGETQLFIRFSDDVHIIDNDFIDTYIGIQESSNIEVYGNKIDTWHYSIFCFDSDNLKISNNQIVSSKDGIALQHCDNSRITHNNITANLRRTGYACLSVQMSNNNTVLDNLFKDYSYGIYLWESNYNLFSRNSFIDLTEKTALVESTILNYWGYSLLDDPSVLGNYYSDFYVKYPDAQPHNEYYMDRPYVHDENNTDFYPLIVASENVAPPAGKLLSRMAISVGEGFDDGLSFGDNGSIKVGVSDGNSGDMIPSALITLLLQKPSGFQVEYVVTAQTNGYIVPIYYVFDESGPWSLTGRWDGNDVYLGANNTYPFTVESQAYGPDSGIPGPPIEAIIFGLLICVVLFYAQSNK